MLSTSNESGSTYWIKYHKYLILVQQLHPQSQEIAVQKKATQIIRIFFFNNRKGNTKYLLPRPESEVVRRDLLTSFGISKLFGMRATWYILHTFVG